MTMTELEMPLKRMSDDQLLALEQAFWKAIQNRDALAVGRMTSEECTIVGATGVTPIDSRTMARMVGSAPYELREYLINSSKARITHLSDDMVAIAYPVHEKLEVDGKDVELEAFDASVWRREQGQWTCVLHTESISGDPFGRDRKPVTETAQA
jgi:hypothetical protein